MDSYRLERSNSFPNEDLAKEGSRTSVSTVEQYHRKAEHKNINRSRNGDSKLVIVKREDNQSKRSSLLADTKMKLEEIFRAKMTPNKEERELICSELGLSQKQVRIWVC